MRGLLCGIVAGIVMAGTSTLSGTIVFDNGGPDRVSGYEVTGWVVADDFALPAPAQIGSATFWTLETPGYRWWDGSLTWYIFQDQGGRPGSYISGTAAASKQATGLQDATYHPEYRYDFNFPSVLSLNAGEKYWLGLHLSADFEMELIYWETTSTGLGGPGAQSYRGTFDNWNGTGTQYAFSLSSPVPEPTAAVATLSALAMLLRRPRRKAKGT